ncbi:Rho GTPase activating protein 26 [Rhizophagus irregularis]|uniref:Rho GTPase activating protein 26 n=1 Tax=Rhizophagus irregularis TaxID=588596 RepID=A0A2N1NMB6_9GLOM|nr:Rho GTPase activating protein 26 [Rhizophagus irregularis]PKK75085.1 Rho GTPase activating protein 26 [Rhizophagus irregularis]
MVLKARAIFDCAADDDQELSFKENAIIVDIVESTDKGWFEGTLEGSKIRGLFPDNYVEFFEVEEV